MKEFKLTLDGVSYEATSNHSGKDAQNWHIKSDHRPISIQIDIPIDSNVSRVQAMAFVESFHEAFKIAKKEQKL